MRFFPGSARRAYFAFCNANADVPVVSAVKEIIAAYKKLLSHLNQNYQFFYPDIHTGRIVWNVQHLMESLVNMY